VSSLAAQPSGDQPDLVPNFAFQLVDVYLHDCSITRREALDADPRQPTFETGLTSDDGALGAPAGAFSAHLKVVINFRFRDEAVITVAATTTGFFVREGSIDDQLVTRFKTLDCAVLLWPYARAHLGELGRMTNVGLPPLPTVDVRSLLTAEQGSQS
jgi:preprotein translocase subunit SecB